MPPAIEPVIVELAQRVPHANVENLSTFRRPTRVADKPTVIMTLSEVEAMLRKGMKKPLFHYLFKLKANLFS